MLGFVAMMDLDGATPEPGVAGPLAAAIPIPAAVPAAFSAPGLRGVQLRHATPMDNDRDLPCAGRDGALLFGVLRLDAREGLRRALGAAGASVRAGASDARLALHAWESWGERCAERLQGDFAFCVWEPDARRLFAVRDHHGNRQLFWGSDGARVVVASAIEGVRAHPPFASGWRDESLASFLHIGYVDEPQHTVWARVNRLPPASVMTFSGSATPRVRRFWEFPLPEPIRYRDGSQYVEHFRAVLGEAVRDRLREPTAAVLLSGGVDSPMLAATARAVAPEVTLYAQTVSYPEFVPSDDDHLAPAVARYLGIVHETVACDDLMPLQWLDAAAPYPPEPADDPDVGVLRRSYAALARHSPVTLFGEDGDTLMRPPTLAGQWRERGAAEVAAAWWSFWRATGRRPWVGLEWRTRLRRGMGRDPDRTPWLLRSAREAGRGLDAPAPHPTRPRTVGLLTSRLWESVYQSIAPSSTRAATLPTLPLVDQRVIEFVFATPGVPWGENKALFREAMRDRLPADVLARPKTPLIGYFEARAAQWRAAGGGGARLSERVAPWVDRARAEALFRDGDPLLLRAAWRALILDRWMMRMERRDA